MTTATPVTALPLPARSDPVDVARGVGLLGAGLAGSVLWLTGRAEGPALRPAANGAADRVLDVLVVLLVDNRVLPLFAVLLGYGAARLHARLEPALGAGGVRRVLARRGLALLGLGLLHAVGVSDSDLLGSLGVLLLCTALLVGARRGWLLLVAGLVSPGLVLLGALDGLGQLGGLLDQSSSYPVSVVDRTGSWFANLVLLLPLGTVGLLAPVLAGVLLARSGWLDRPRGHRRALVPLAVGGLAVAVLGAVPLALAAGRLVTWPALWDSGAGALSWVTGVAGALGAVASTALLVPVLPGRVASWLAAVGRFSLTGYLLQSVVLALVAAPWAGARGAVWGSVAMATVALLVWLATVVVAVRWEAARGRGPAEALLRRWSYGGRPYDRASGVAQPSELHGRERSSAT